MHYAKESYIKSYLFDRKLNYLEKINGEEHNDSNIDSKKWRYKIWYDNKEKIKVSDRRFNIIVDILSIIFWSTFCCKWFSTRNNTVGLYINYKYI